MTHKHFAMSSAVMGMVGLKPRMRERAARLRKDEFCMCDLYHHGTWDFGISFGLIHPRSLGIITGLVKN